MTPRLRTLYLLIAAPLLAVGLVGAVVNSVRHVSANRYLAQGLQFIAAQHVRAEVNRELVFALASAGVLLVAASMAVRRLGPVALVYVYTVVLWLLIARIGFAHGWATTMVVFGVPLPSLLWQPRVVGGLLAGGMLSLLFAALVLRLRRRPAGQVGMALPRALTRSALAAMAGSVAFVVALNAMAALVPPAPVPHPVNVIWITWDSARADHVSAYGYPRPTTPHLDALARDAVLFETAVSQHNWTRPSYASMLTSLYEWDFPGSIMGLPQVTVAEMLKNHGYRTVGFVQNPNLDPAFDFDQGFDSYVQLHHKSTPEALNRFVLPRISDLAERGEPFFLFVHYQGPHWPYRLDNPFLQQFVSAERPLMDPEEIDRLMSSHGKRWDASAPDAERKVGYMLDLYDASIRWTDEALGEVLELLRATNLLDRSLLIFNSDHGDEFHERGRFGHAHRNLHPELTFVPLIVRFPTELGVAPRRVATLVENLDIVPTVLGVAGIDPPQRLAGRDLFPERAPSSAERLALSNIGAYVALRTSRYALFVDYLDSDQSVSFFNVRADPEERHPLSGFEQDPEFAQLTLEGDLWHAQYQQSTPARTTVAAPSQAVIERLRSLGYEP